MKTKMILLAAMLFFLSSCALFKSCRQEPEPKPKPEPPVYEEVTDTVYPDEFGFKEGAGVDIEDDDEGDILELRRTSKGALGNAWYSFPDSGASILDVRMRKSRSSANPKLGVFIGETQFFSVAPVDTFSNYASVVIPLGPSVISLRFEPDSNNVKSSAKIYVKRLKITTKRLVKP